MTRPLYGYLLLAVLALSARWLALVVCDVPLSAPTTYEHGEIARHLIAGEGFRVRFLGVDGPTSQQAPWVPTVLAGCYALLGVDTPAALGAFYALQCLAGVFTVWSVVWLTGALFPERPAARWIAGLIAALFPTHVYMVTHVQAAPWAAMALCLLCAVVARRWQHGAAQGMVAGLVAGGLVLIEPILALGWPVAAVWLARPPGKSSPIEWRDVSRRWLAAGMAVVLVVAPWIARNHAVHGEWVFIKSTFGYAFWQGNHPLSWGTDKIPKPEVATLLEDHDGSWSDQHRALWEARHETLYIDDVVLTRDDYARLATLNEPARSRWLGEQAWGWIAADPARYARQSLRRLSYFLFIDTTNPKTSATIYRVTTFGWWSGLLVGLAAAWPWRRRWWPLAMVALGVTLFHALTITSARFRIPLEPLSFPLIALGVVVCGERFVEFGRRIVLGLYVARMRRAAWPGR